MTVSFLDKFGSDHADLVTVEIIEQGPEVKIPTVGLGVPDNEDLSGFRRLPATDVLLRLISNIATACPNEASQGRRSD